MSEQKESSVLFNLKELMGLEEERIQSEEDSRRKRAEEEAQQRAEQEARARAEVEARARAEEDSRLEAERRARAEEERLTRDREAHALRVRLEAEAKERAAEAERQRQHDLQVKQLEAQRRKGVHPGLLAAVAVLAIGGGAYGYYGVYIPQQNAAAAKQAEVERLARETAIEKQRVADEAEQLRIETERKLAAARKEAEEAKQASAAAAEKERIRRENDAIAARANAEKSSSSSARKPSGKKPETGGKPSRSDGDDPLAGLDGI